MNIVHLKVMGADYVTKGGRHTDVFCTFCTDAEYEDVEKAVEMVLYWVETHPGKYEGWDKEMHMKYRSKLVQDQLKAKGFQIRDAPSGTDYSFYISDRGQ